ncbi:DUF2332 domain-containing protein [Rossellomorea aquimaris]|nr:DUF2332 domain-containing protein [Rossellomorea aquimaris]
MDISALSKTFQHFAARECKGSSELYEYLSVKISEDEDILALSANAQKGQPVPNLLLGAVHYLLWTGVDHPLKTYYPSVTGNAVRIDDETFTMFKSFCSLYRDEIISLLKEKRVQTNEVRRCAYLYPVFSMIYQRVEKPLSLIEIGTSAGLQLLWDQYSYSYGTEEVFGHPHSPVHLTSRIKGKPPSFLPDSAPPVASRIGLDLHVSDLRTDEDYVWLKSLIWPEHKERRELFENAAAYFRKNPVNLLEGDGVALLSEVIRNIPEDSVVCLFHTHVANQFPEELKNELMEKVKSIGRKRDVFHIYNNMWDRKLHVDSIVNGVESSHTMGETDGHGRWFEWNEW